MPAAFRPAEPEANVFNSDLKRGSIELLFGVSPADPTTFAAAAALLLAVAAAAGYLPARRASRVDPTVVIRAE